MEVEVFEANLLDVAARVVDAHGRGRPGSTGVPSGILHVEARWCVLSQLDERHVTDLAVDQQGATGDALVGRSRAPEQVLLSWLK